MPLIFADVGADYTVQKVGGNAATRKHLETLGFVEGHGIKVVSNMAQNLIVRVKDTSIALDRDLARRIQVS